MREYREEFLQRVALLLDTHFPMPPGLPPLPSFESAVSLAAAIGDYFARSEFALDVFADGPTIHSVPAGLGEAARDQVMDLLAATQADTGQAELDWDGVERDLSGHLGQITLIVCIMQDWDEPRQEFVERLRDYGTGLKVVIVRDTPCTLPPGDWPVLTSAQVAGGVDEV